MSREFSKNLALLRAQRGLSRAELAAIASLSGDAIRSLEVGRRQPRASTLVALARALRVTPARLYGRGGS